MKTMYYRKDDIEDLLNSFKADKQKAPQREALMEELLKVESKVDSLESKYGTSYRS